MSLNPRSGAGAGEPRDQLVEPVARCFVGGLRVDPRPDVSLGDRQDRLADMVEEEHPVVEREREVGNAAIVGRNVGQVLGVSHGIVRRQSRPHRR